MNGIMIPVLETFSHLGAGIGNDTSIVNNMIKKGRTAFYGLLSLGSKCGGILPTIGSKLYWQCVIPSMLYGVELLSLSDNGIEQLEKEHRKFGKRLQQLPTTTSNPAAYALLGWQSIQGHIDQKVMTFIYSIFRLPCHHIYKKVLLHRLIEIEDDSNNKGGPTANFVNTTKRYKLNLEVNNALETGTCESKDSWKHKCKSQIKQFELNIFKTQTQMYEKLKHIRNAIPSMSIWWQVAHTYPELFSACKLMVKFAVGEEPLNINQSRYSKEDHKSKLCQICGEGMIENAEHVIFNCPELKGERELLCKALNTFSDQCVTNICISKDVKAIVNGTLDSSLNRRKHIDKLAIIACMVQNMVEKRNELNAQT